MHPLAKKVLCVTSNCVLYHYLQVHFKKLTTGITIWQPSVASGQTGQLFKKEGHFALKSRPDVSLEKLEKYINVWAAPSIINVGKMGFP